MINVFIAGSRKISHLDKPVQARLDRIVENSFSVLVGDANGADKAVQKYFMMQQYEKVTVFCSGLECRNNLGHWEVQKIKCDKKIRGYKFYMAKDIEMAKEANYGFMIWDGKSSGTFSNVLELHKQNKKIAVYFMPTKEFFNIENLVDIQGLLAKCEPCAIEEMEKKIDFTDILKRGNAQLQLF